MRNLNTFKKLTIGSMFSAMVLVGTALTASAQDRNEEYREWQRAQAVAMQEQQQYYRTRSRDDYRDWQRAQRRAQREYQEYQRVNTGYNNGYYNNNSRWNNGNMRFRVYRNGSYYSTDARGAELLRTAVRNGYTQGYRQGEIDRQYGRQYDYDRSSYYRNGNYGYQAHVARNQYQYYFRQGFQRGYEDGFNRSYQYGTRSGNTLNILGSVLNTILNFTNQ